MIAVPATPATTTAVTKGANSRIEARTKKPPSRSRAPKSDEEVGRLQARRAEAEGDGRDQQREPAELQGEEELADELLAVGIGRLDRGDDRPRGEDHHVPHLFEQRLGGQECPVDRGSDHLLLRRAAPHARDAPLVS